MKTTNFLASAKQLIQDELDAIEQLNARLGDEFNQACELILHRRGRVIVTGMGKSGHIGNKIAATMASTGTPAFFIHPSEALHGDMGMITPDDIVLALSNSGETTEVVQWSAFLKHYRIPLISMTGNANSSLAKVSDVHLSIAVTQEACPLNLAPTSSTTVTLVLGDALAVSLLQARGFSAEDFARFHPGGNLGRQLLLQAKDIARMTDKLPRINSNATVSEALIEMTQKQCGMTTVTENQKLIGVFTDGDLRRALEKNIALNDARVKDVMTCSPKSIAQNTLASEALSIMETNRITVLVLTDEEQQPIGILQLHDLLNAGFRH